ncbi:unnamed protein product [marine sediment metagenome]|uniref:Acetyltransferase n=1 Tax=marine sediment metagenome TaxID=412755 RepID=X1C9R1_9ZZZZ
MLELLKHSGKNATIYPLAKIINPENLSLGDESNIADFCFIYAIGKGIEIGNFCNIGEHVIIQSGGLVKLGDFVGLGARSTVYSASDSFEGDGLSGLNLLDNKYRSITYKDIIINKHAIIGMCSIIMPGVTIGEGCSIGIGSLVTKDMPPWAICYGSPCKPIRPKPKEKQLAMEKEFLKEYYQGDR